MIVDVNTFTRRFGPLIASHYMIAHILHDREITQRRPLTYQATTFHSSATSKLTPPNMIILEYPTLSSAFISSHSRKFSTVVLLPSGHTISSSTVLFTSHLSTDEYQLRSSQQYPEIRVTIVVFTLFSEWWCVNDVLGSLCHDTGQINPLATRWNFKFIFKNSYKHSLF